MTGYKGLNQDAQLGLELLEKAAAASEVYVASKAKYLLAVCYEYGKNVPEDKSRAMELRRCSANAGDPDAQFALALNLLQVQFLEMSQQAVEDEPDDEAVCLLEAAAAQGHAKAQTMLGLVVYYRKPRDGLRAARLWLNAAAKGDQDALGFCNIHIADKVGCPELTHELAQEFLKDLVDEQDSCGQVTEDGTILFSGEHYLGSADEGCAVCGDWASQRCKGCMKVRYCSRKHQKEHWKKQHKYECK